MANYKSPLDDVKVAAPCPADWNSMVGDQRVRFCSQCELNVYNLSGMSTQNAERLIMSAEGRLCVRFYRRNDGTIITRDCPVGLRSIKRRASRMAHATLSVIVGFLSGIGLNFAMNGNLQGSGQELRTMGVMMAREPEITPVREVEPVAPDTHEMGEIMVRIEPRKTSTDSRRALR